MMPPLRHYMLLNGPSLAVVNRGTSFDSAGRPCRGQLQMLATTCKRVTSTIASCFTIHSIKSYVQDLTSAVWHMPGAWGCVQQQVSCAGAKCAQTFPAFASRGALWHSLSLRDGSWLNLLS